MFVLQQELLTKRFDEDLKKRFLIHINFLTMILIDFLCCCKMLFTHIITWMVGKNSMKYYLQKKIFKVTVYI